MSRSKPREELSENRLAFVPYEASDIRRAIVEARKDRDIDDRKDVDDAGPLSSLTLLSDAALWNNGRSPDGTSSVATLERNAGADECRLLSLCGADRGSSSLGSTGSILIIGSDGAWQCFEWQGQQKTTVT